MGPYFGIHPSPPHLNLSRSILYQTIRSVGKWSRLIAFPCAIIRKNPTVPSRTRLKPGQFVLYCPTLFRPVPSASF